MNRKKYICGKEYRIPYVFNIEARRALSWWLYQRPCCFDVYVTWFLNASWPVASSRHAVTSFWPHHLPASATSPLDIAGRVTTRSHDFGTVRSGRRLLFCFSSDVARNAFSSKTAWCEQVFTEPPWILFYKLSTAKRLHVQSAKYKQWLMHTEELDIAWKISQTRVRIQGKERRRQHIAKQLHKVWNLVELHLLIKPFFLSTRHISVVRITKLLSYDTHLRRVHCIVVPHHSRVNGEKHLERTVKKTPSVTL